MPTVLDVFAAPRNARSRTLKLRDAFLAAYRAKHPDFVHIPLDLSAHHAELPAFDEWDIQAKFEMAYGEGKLDEQAAKRWDRLVELTDQLHASDLLLVSAPMWNFGIPWMLKRWIDCVVQGRLTFEYVNGQLTGLLQGKRAVVFSTRDGAYGPGTPMAHLDHNAPYLKSVLGLIGYAPVDVIIAEPMAMNGPEVAQQALEQAMREATLLAQSL